MGTITQKGFGKQWKLRDQGFFESETLYGQTEDQEFEIFCKAFETSPEKLTGKRILDAGCGSGRLTRTIARKTRAMVVGIDISSSVTVAKSGWHNMQVIQCDLTRPPLKPQSFHYVWSEGVLHHSQTHLRA